MSVLIVGAGPTGLAAANLLGMLGVDTLVVERNAGLSDMPRAISLDDEGLRILQALGLGDALRDCILPDLAAHYISAGRFLAKVTPTSKKNGYSLISTFHQPELEEVLLAGLQRFDCVHVSFQQTVEAVEQTDEGVTVALRTPTGEVQQVQCSYLLACDGGKSSVRRSLGMSMQGTTYAQKWLVVDCIADDDAAAVATFFCNSSRPAVSVPAPHHGRRWEFMLLPGETEEEMVQPAKVMALIQQVGGSSHPQIARRAIYTFHAALASSFSQGRVFLLGDAAHMMPPFGGQGLNSGLRDAHNLAWKVALVLQGMATPHLLQSYTRERHPHVAQMIRFSALLGTIVMPTKRPFAFCRDMAFYGLNALAPVREYISEARIKPQPRYTRGLFLFTGNRQQRAITGQLFPQPEVMTSEGMRVLLDELLGPGFALLRRHERSDEAFATIQNDFWERLGTRFICIQTDQPQQHVRSIVKREERLRSDVGSFAVTTVYTHDADVLRMVGRSCVLVRPDRFICGVFDAEKADTFVSAFQRLLQGLEA